MAQLLTTIWRICRFKAGPQDLPSSLPLFIGLLLSNAIINLLALSLDGLNIDIVRQSIVLLIVPISFNYAVLSISKHKERFLQTITAQNAVNVLLSLLIIPLLMVHPHAPLTEQSTTSDVIISLFYIIVFLSFNVWLILITAHIYRHALSIRFMYGLLITFALMGINVLVFSVFK